MNVATIHNSGSGLHQDFPACKHCTGILQSLGVNALAGFVNPDEVKGRRGDGQ